MVIDRMIVHLNWLPIWKANRDSLGGQIVQGDPPEGLPASVLSYISCQTNLHDAGHPNTQCHKPPRGTRERRATMIEARGLTKKYGNLTAVDHLNLEVRPGEIYGFLGRVKKMKH